MNMNSRVGRAIVFLLLVFMIQSFYMCNDERGTKIVVKTKEGKKIPLYEGAYAFIVGNGNYKNGWDPLPGALKDVDEVAAVLTKFGYNVTLRKNLDRKSFDKAFMEFSYQCGRNRENQILFYFSGHGYTEKMANDENMGYIVMVDSPLPESDLINFKLSSVDMQFFVTQAKTIQSKHVLFVFDSCFSGTILNFKTHVTPEYVSDIVKYPVRQFITAGRENEKVPDLSVFKQAFLDLLEGRDKEPMPDGYITGEEMGLYLKQKVPKYNPKQHPQYGKINDPKLDKGDFVFVHFAGKRDVTNDLNVQPVRSLIGENSQTKVPGKPREVTVPAKPADWSVDVLTETPIYVKKGDTISFSASGEWTVGLGYIGPDGKEDSCECLVRWRSGEGFRGYVGALIGRIGLQGKPFLIGAGNTITAVESGKLFIGSNDNLGPCDGTNRGSCYNDNLGEIKVRVEIR